MKKVLICSIPSDTIQNNYIRDYIIEQYKENNEIRVLSEGALGSLASLASKYEISDELTKMTTELEKTGIKVVGIDDMVQETEGSGPSWESLGLEYLEKVIKPLSKEHDDSIFNYIKQEKNSCIAVICPLHAIYWLSQDKINSDEYEVLFPVHSKTLLELTSVTGAKGKNIETIEKFYNQILSLIAIKVIDIDENPLPKKEKEESKERAKFEAETEVEIAETDSVTDFVSSQSSSSFGSTFSSSLSTISSQSSLSTVSSTSGSTSLLTTITASDYTSDVSERNLVGSAEEVSDITF